MGEPTALIEFDGACSGNPGPAAYGVVVEFQGEETEVAEQIGEATNNVAEYRGAVAGLKKTQELGAKHVVLQGDSQLIIRQLTGEYSVNSNNLKHLYSEAQELLEGFDEVEIKWVQRESNTRADQLAQDELS